MFQIWTTLKVLHYTERDWFKMFQMKYSGNNKIYDLSFFEKVGFM
jgi:hypothetical protein